MIACFGCEEKSWKTVLGDTHSHASIQIIYQQKFNMHFLIFINWNVAEQISNVKYIQGVIFYYSCWYIDGMCENLW